MLPWGYLRGDGIGESDLGGDCSGARKLKTEKMEKAKGGIAAVCAKANDLPFILTSRAL